MKKRGFTLIELVAAIAILGIMLAIAVPIVTNIMQNSSRKGFISDAKMLLETLKIEKTSNRDLDLTTINESNLYSTLGVSSENYNNVEILMDADAPFVKIEGAGKWDGLTVCGTEDNLKIVADITNCVIDRDAPVITIISSNPVSINVNSVYVDFGATALDAVDGDLTSKINTTSNISTNVPGTYTVTYSVTDLSGNVGTATRTVNIVDNVNPVLTFNPYGSITYEKTKSATITATDISGIDTNQLLYAFSTSSTIAPSLNKQYTNGGTVTLSSGTGIYYLWAKAYDKAGNFTVSCPTTGYYLDNTAPAILIAGSNPVSIELGSTYTDAGATADDEHSGINGNVTATSNVNPNTVGSYTVTYTVNDKAGNTTTVTRTVNVVDTTAPTVTFGMNGNATWAKARSTMVTISDNTVINSGGFRWFRDSYTATSSDFGVSGSGFSNPSTLETPQYVTGSFYLWIRAQDSSYNSTIVRSNVFNLDYTAPVITLTGASTVSIPEGSTYTDAGATATDAHSGISENVTAHSNVNPNVAGTYSVWYSVSDNAGNAATTVYRTVKVTDVTAPVITLWGPNPATVFLNYDSYIERGFIATDDTDGNITSSVTITSNINPSAIGSYTITYTAKDSQNNTATATRIVNIIDTTVPQFSLLMAGGLLNQDPTFASGLNGVSIYNNTGNGTVTVNRTAISGAPEGSGYGLTISTNGTPSPGWGGFTFNTMTSASKVFITRIVAKIPVGYTINWASNAIGTGGTSSWLTSQEGTGTWAEYICRVNTGSSGTFADTNYFYLNGGTTPTASAPLTWYVAYAGVMDSTKWATSNSIILIGNDYESGIVGYGINQSSTIEPTFTTVSARQTMISMFNNIIANGTYYVWEKDQAGNLSKSSINVSYIDRTPPVITITGSNPAYIDAGSTYTDAGATATDSQSGVNGNVAVTSNINPSVAGTYTVTYNISDKAGNVAAPVSRTVVVKSTSKLAGGVTTYTPGQAISYAGINWHVVKDNGASVMLLADSGTIPTKMSFDTRYNASYPSCTYSPTGYCGINVWSTSNLKTYLNGTWYNNSLLSTSVLVDDGNGYIRLITQSEYNTLLSTVGSQPWLYSSTISWWWTLTAASQYMVNTVTDTGGVSSLMEAFDRAYPRPLINVKKDVSYVCSSGTLTYDASRGGYICTASNVSYITTNRCDKWSYSAWNFSETSCSSPSTSNGCGDSDTSCFVCMDKSTCSISNGGDYYGCEGYVASRSITGCEIVVDTGGYYACPSGWTTYSGSGSTTVCYTAAILQ